MPIPIRPATSTVPNDDTIVGSASVDGRLIKVHETTNPGTLLHQGAASGGGWDRVTIMACNNDTVNRDITVLLGTATAAAGDIIVRTLFPKQGLRMILDRAPLKRTLPIYAKASAADVVNCLVEIQGLKP